MGAWPEDLDPHITPELDRSALVVIDTQVDFVDGGASPIPGTSEVVPGIAALLRAYRDAGRPVVHVVRLYEGQDVDLVRRTLIASGAPVVRPGSAGSQIVPELQPAGAAPLDPDQLRAGAVQALADGEWAVWKPRWDAFHRTPLDDHLRGLGVTTVVLAGCNYPNCPRATVYGASARDYRVLIASDAVSGIRPSHLEEAALMGVVHAPSSDVVSRLAGLAALSPSPPERGA
ncbi:cysteine hydrolase family protein [Geodermatophilus sp. SYSU D00697]